MATATKIRGVTLRPYELARLLRDGSVCVVRAMKWQPYPAKASGLLGPIGADDMAWPLRQCRIMSVESVFWNQRGGWTAVITVTPLLVSGRIGKTRNLILTINANGTGLKGLGRDVVERITPPRNA